MSLVHWPWLLAGRLADREAFNGGIVEDESETGSGWNHDRAALKENWLGHNRLRPGHQLEQLRCRAGREEMDRDLGKQVACEWHPPGLGQCRDAYPPGHAADPLDVRHHDVTTTGLNQGPEASRQVDVLAGR